MKERPIIFNGEMIRAIFDDRKTQTRRVIKPQPSCSLSLIENTDQWTYTLSEYKWKCPYGAAGDRLWVRETFDTELYDKVIYRADYASYKAFTGEYPKGRPERWKPSIHMPRWASRINLEITNVRVNKLWDTTTADAIAEGVKQESDTFGNFSYHTGFRHLWNSINYKRGYGWHTNPFVWVVDFKKLDRR